MANIQTLPTYILVSCVLLTACGESDGPSLLSAGGGAGTGTPPGFLTFTNGMAADIVIGQPNFFSNSTSCASAQFSDLRDTDFGASGRVWIADGGNARALAFNALPTTSGASFDFAIGQFNPSGCINNGTANDQFEEAEGVAESGTQLFVADGASNRRIQVFDPLPTSDHPNAVFSIGAANANSIGAGTCDAASIGAPRTIFATANRLFVADSACHRVLIYALPITADQPTPVRVLGQINFTSSASATTSSGLNSPWSVWSDDTKIAVVDAANHRVLLWDSFPTANGQPADRVIGQANFNSGSAALSQNQLDFTTVSQPKGGVFFTGQQLFVADTGNNRVLIWNGWPSSNGQSADSVLGQSAFTTKISGTSQLTLDTPLSVKVHAPYMYVSDAFNSRVMVWRGL